MTEIVDGLKTQIAQTVAREQLLLAELEAVRGTRRGLLEKLQAALPQEPAPITPIGMWRERHIRQQQEAEAPLFKPSNLIFEGGPHE